MSWFKVDDRLPLSPKFIDLPMSAVGLWTMAGAWCGSQLTDGALSKRMVARLGGDDEDAVALVKAGLWDIEPDGYRFHNWLVWQPSREDVHAERAAGRERAARSRKKRKGVITEHSSPQETPDDAPDLGPADEDLAPLDDQQHHDEYRRGDEQNETPLEYSPTSVQTLTEAREELEGLRSRLDDAGLRVSWKGLEKDAAEIRRLLSAYGAAELVAVARRLNNPGNPARSYRAWMDDWAQLRVRPPRKANASTTTTECPIHPGQPQGVRCSQCNAPGKPMPADFRQALQRVGKGIDEDSTAGSRSKRGRSPATEPEEGEQ